jgi:hypothetical protein
MSSCSTRFHRANHGRETPFLFISWLERAPDLPLGRRGARSERRARDAPAALLHSPGGHGDLAAEAHDDRMRDDPALARANQRSLR